MKSILIVDVNNANYPARKLVTSHVPCRELFIASIAIFRDADHFKCVKNRWARTDDASLIPNELLKPYLLLYADFISKEDIIDSLL